MALFNVTVLWQRSRFTLQWLIINLVGSLACLSAVALAQFEWSEGVSGSVSIPDVAFTCIGNLAVFMAAFMRGRLDMENGARDVLATTRGPKLYAIKWSGLTTCPLNDLTDVDVIMLAKYNQRPHSSLTQFIEYISHSHGLESILLQFFPFTSAPLTQEICNCNPEWKCRCIVFWATEKIMIMLARRLPGTLKQLSESQCLLPSLSCLENGCHGCNQVLWYREAADESSEHGRLTVGDRRVDSPAAVCEALEDFPIKEGSSCICIPVHPWNTDRWTKYLIKFLKSKEKEAKGIKVMASDALEKYTTQSPQELGFSFQTRTRCIVVAEIYESASLILLRVAEVLVNIVLTGWLRLDGFSSSLVSRRAIRDYLVDSTGTGFAANAFLTEATVLCSGDKSNVCQLLRVRGGLLSARRVSYIVGCVNVLCSIAWSVLIACEGNWAPSMPLSTPRVAVILGAVGVALGMDCSEFSRARARARARNLYRDLYTDPEAVDLDFVLAPVRVQVRARALARALARAQAEPPEARAQARALLWAQMHAGSRAQIWGLGAALNLEVWCIVSLVASLRMKMGLGRWVYSVMQVLVWVKWGIGSFLLGDMATEDELGTGVRLPNNGRWVYCSAFLLNAMLAGVRRKWVYYVNL